ncbi:MAG: signal peptidase II [Oscillospiraceae bacterium]
MLYSIVGLLVIILDQAVKYWVQNTLFGTDIVKFIPGVISLVNVHNDGAAFSFLSGSGARIYFIIATGVFTVLVIIALATNFISGKVSRWSLVLVTAGGLANCIDRVIYGYVQDMFKVELFNFAIFNVADVFITVFAIVFVLAMIFEKPEDDDLEDEEFEDEEDEEDDSPRPSLRDKLSAMKKEKNAAPRAVKKSRQAEYEEEYERYKAQREPRSARPAAQDACAESTAGRRIRPLCRVGKGQRQGGEPAFEQLCRKGHGCRRTEVYLARKAGSTAVRSAAPSGS